MIGNYITNIQECISAVETNHQVCSEGDGFFNYAKNNNYCSCCTSKLLSKNNQVVSIDLDYYENSNSYSIYKLPTDD